MAVHLIHVHLDPLQLSSRQNSLSQKAQGGVRGTRSNHRNLDSRIIQRPKDFNNNCDGCLWRGGDKNCQTAPLPISITCQNKYYSISMNDVTSYEKGERGRLHEGIIFKWCIILPQAALTHYVSYISIYQLITAKWSSP